MCIYHITNMTARDLVNVSLAFTSVPESIKAVLPANEEETTIKLPTIVCYEAATAKRTFEFADSPSDDRVVSCTLTYAFEEEESTLQFETVLTPSAFISTASPPVSRQEFITLLRSACTKTEARAFAASSLAEAAKKVKTHFNLHVVEQLKDKVSLYGRMVNGSRPIAFLLKEDPNVPDSYAVAIRSDSQELSQSLAKELEGLSSRG